MPEKMRKRGTLASGRRRGRCGEHRSGSEVLGLLGGLGARACRSGASRKNRPGGRGRVTRCSPSRGDRTCVPHSARVPCFDRSVLRRTARYLRRPAGGRSGRRVAALDVRPRRQAGRAARLRRAERRLGRAARRAAASPRATAARSPSARRDRPASGWRPSRWPSSSPRRRSSALGARAVRRGDAGRRAGPEGQRPALRGRRAADLHALRGHLERAGARRPARDAPARGPGRHAVLGASAVERLRAGRLQLAVRQGDHARERAATGPRDRRRSATAPSSPRRARAAGG